MLGFYTLLVIGLTSLGWWLVWRSQDSKKSVDLKCEVDDPKHEEDELQEEVEEEIAAPTRATERHSEDFEESADGPCGERASPSEIYEIEEDAGPDVLVQPDFQVVVTFGGTKYH